MLYPDCRTPPSQHGAPCPHEGDETAQYARLVDDIVMALGPLLPVGLFGAIIYFRWFA